MISLYPSLLTVQPARQPATVFLQGLCSVQELAASPQPDVWALSRLLQFEARQVGELSLQVVALEYKYYKSNIASLFINLK